MYSYSWQRKGDGNLGSALVAPPTSEKSQGPSPHGVCVSCKMEGDKIKTKAKPYICQFQNWIKCYEEIKTG